MVICKTNLIEAIADSIVYRDCLSICGYTTDYKVSTSVREIMVTGSDLDGNMIIEKMYRYN